MGMLYNMVFAAALTLGSAACTVMSRSDYEALQQRYSDMETRLANVEGGAVVASRTVQALAAKVMSGTRTVVNLPQNPLSLLEFQVIGAAVAGLGSCVNTLGGRVGGVETRVANGEIAAGASYTKTNERLGSMETDLDTYGKIFANSFTYGSILSRAVQGQPGTIVNSTTSVAAVPLALAVANSAGGGIGYSLIEQLLQSHGVELVDVTLIQTIDALREAYRAPQSKIDELRFDLGSDVVNKLRKDLYGLYLRDEKVVSGR